MSSQAKRSDPKLPTDAHALKTMMLVILEKSLENMDRLRDREQVLQLIDTLRSPDAIMGGVRRIKPTGIVREVDELGRVVLPMELRRTMGIGRKDAVEISVEGNWVVIQPYKQFCHFCGSDKDISPFKGKYICETCVGDLFDNVDVNV